MHNLEIEFIVHCNSKYIFKKELTSWLACVVRTVKPRLSVLIRNINAQLLENTVNPLILPCVVESPEIIMVNIVASVIRSELIIMCTQSSSYLACSLHVLIFNKNIFADENH